MKQKIEVKRIKRREKNMNNEFEFKEMNFLTP